MSNTPGLVSAAAAALAALVAALQIYLSRRDANRRATLDHLWRIDCHLQQLWTVDTADVQSAVLKFYQNPTALSPEAVEYLALLNSLDLLAFAIDHGMVNKNLAETYIASLIKAHVLNITFVTKLQQCCADTSVYENLRELVIRINQRKGQNSGFNWILPWR